MDTDGEGMLQEWYQPSQYTIRTDAEVSKKIPNLQLVLNQQSLLMSSIHPEHFGWDKCH